MTTDTNVMLNDISGDDYTSQITTALQDAVDILKTHCGPFARNAIIPSKASAKNEVTGLDINYVVDRFTKDGITIVRGLSTKSPAHKYALRQVKYVGNSVDKACHDGTTTSMMFTALVMLGAMKAIKDGHVSRLSLADQFTKLIQIGKKGIEKSTISVDELASRLMRLGFSEREALFAIYYNQAMITSKRDVKLSRAVAEAAMSIPKQLMGHFSYKRCGYETKEAFIIEKHDYQISFRAEVDQKFCNVNMGTAIKLEDVDLFITPNMLTPESNETKMFLSLLGHPAFPKEDWYNLPSFEETLERPLLIVAYQNTAHLLGDTIEKWNAKNPTRPIIFVQMLAMNRTQQLVSDTTAAIAGQDMGTQDRPFKDFYKNFIHHVDFSYDNRMAKFTKLFDDSEFYHPFYKDTTKTFYQKTLTELLDIIDRFKRSHNKSASDRAQCELAATLIRQMILSNITDLMIGGNIINNVAAIHAVEDSLGSVLSVIENGMVLGGYFKFLKALRVASTEGAKTITPRMIAFHILKHAAEEILKTTYSDPSNPFLVAKDPELTIRLLGNSLTKKTGNHELGNDWVYAIPGEEKSDALLEIISLAEIDNLKSLVRSTKTGENFTALLQPAMCFIEQLNRIEEILPHFINSDRLLDTGIDDEGV